MTVEPTVFPLVVRAGGGSVRDSLSILDQLLAGAGPEGVTYRSAVGLLGVTDEALLDEAVDALAASDAPGVFQAVDRVVEAGHDPRRFATDLLDRLRDLIVLQAVPEATGNGLLDCPPDRLDLMSRQAQALGGATLSRMADTVHEGLTEMRGTTAPRLLLELVCARMLLPGVDDSATATLQRLERLERRMSIAGEHAGRPEAPVAAAPDAPGPRRARCPPPRAAPAPAPAPAAAAAPPPAAALRPPLRRRQRRGRRTCARPRRARPRLLRAAAAAPAPAAPEGDDGWPVTARPGAWARRRPRRPPRPRRRPAAAVPSAGDGAGSPTSRSRPSPPTTRTGRSPPGPGCGGTAPAAPTPRQPAAPEPAGQPAPAPRAAAESAPAPRGGEPTPLVSATPAEPAGDDGELTTADVRRIWPELLSVVKKHKRTTEALLKSAQVHDLTNGDADPGGDLARAGQDARRRPEQGHRPAGAAGAARRPLEGAGRRRHPRPARRRPDRRPRRRPGPRPRPRRAPRPTS